MRAPSLSASCEKSHVCRHECAEWLQVRGHGACWLVTELCFKATTAQSAFPINVSPSSVTATCEYTNPACECTLLAGPRASALSRIESS